MASVDLVSLSARMMRAEHELAALAVPVHVIDDTVGCLAAEELLNDTEVTSLAVRDAAGRVGLLSRSNFLAALSGRFGFGRALLSRTVVGELCDWDCLVVEAGLSIPSAVHRALDRPPESRYDDVLVRMPHGLAMVSTARLVEAMAGLLASRSLQDQLTGLANRELAFHHLSKLCEQTEPEAHVAVVYVDLDEFKQVNDTLGHSSGDALLVSTAKRLQAAARAGDLVARLGGDEFAVVIGLDHRQGPAETVAEALGRRFLMAVNATEAGLTPCRASVGVAMARVGEADADTLLREADLAMYAAKSSGGGRLRVTSRVTRLAPGGRPLLLTGIENGWLETFFQPIVDLTTERPVSIEALARLRHPQEGLLTPAAFMPGAGPAALRRLDDAVLRTALRTVSAHEARHGPVAGYVNVNLSLASLGREDLATHMLAIFTEVGFPAERVRLEIPEIADFGTVQRATPQLRALQEAGVAVTLDDVGAGSTSLRHISQLAVDGLKIDRSLVAGVAANDRDLAVVRMLVDLAAGLGLSVTAEGVETEEQRSVLRSLGCSYGQGYLLGRPAPMAQLAGRQGGPSH